MHLYRLILYLYIICKLHSSFWLSNPWHVIGWLAISLTPVMWAARMRDKAMCMLQCVRECVFKCSDSPWTRQAAKLREKRWLKGEQSGGGDDDGHLRAAAVTHSSSGFYFSWEIFRPTDEGTRRSRFTSPRLNLKSGCGSEGINNLHPLSDWSSDCYVRWRQLKVTKLGFVSRCVPSSCACQTGFCVGLNFTGSPELSGCLQVWEVITETLRLPWVRGCWGWGCLFNNLFRDGQLWSRSVSRPGSKCILWLSGRFLLKHKIFSQHLLYKCGILS